MFEEKLAYPFREFCTKVGIGPTKGYAEVKAGRLKIRKLGKKTLVLAEDGKDWLSSLPLGDQQDAKEA